MESVCITSSLLTTAGEEWRCKPSICNAQSTAQIKINVCVCVCVVVVVGGGGGGRKAKGEGGGLGGGGQTVLDDRKSAGHKEKKERRVRLEDTKREEERK